MEQRINALEEEFKVLKSQIKAVLLDIKEYLATGKRYDAGKSCIRFRKLDDLPLDLIAKVISSMEVNEFVRDAERARRK